MFKKYRFFSQLLKIMKDKDISYNQMIELSKSIDKQKKDDFFNNIDNYNQSLREDVKINSMSEEERKSYYSSLISEKLLNILPSQMIYYSMNNDNFWVDDKYYSGLDQNDENLKKIIASFEKLLNSKKVTNHFLFCQNSFCSACDAPVVGFDNIDVNITGDWIFNTVHISKLSIMNLPLKKKKETKDYYKSTHIASWYGEFVVYQKDFSLLMLAAKFGCNTLIELLIKKGCDIHYKEPLTGKKAIDFYTPLCATDSKQVQYIQSLLNGTYQNGYYEKMYLENLEHKSVALKSVKEQNNAGKHYGLYSDLLQDVENKIEQLKSLDLGQEDKEYLTGVVQKVFIELVKKSQQEVKAKENGNAMDANLQETINMLYEKVEQLYVNNLAQNHKQTKIIQKYLSGM